MNTASPTPAAATDDWRRDGACRDHDPEVFFPVGNSAAAQADTREAKAICRGCPFKNKCLSHALDQDIRHGIWGGTTERERARLAGYLAPDEASSVTALLEHAAELITQLDAEGLRPGEIAARLRSTPQAVSAALTKLNLKPIAPGPKAETGDTA
jgi:WhiB family redox-sensing transcriptional regulator